MKIVEKLRKTRYMQYLAALSATFAITCTSLIVTWPSPTLPLLTSNDSPIGVKITSEEASWVASSVLLGAIAGGIISGRIVAVFGRKRILLLCSLPLFFSWIAIIFAESTITLYIARFIAGIGICCVFTVVPIYLGETADKDIRGQLGTTINMLSITGSLYILTVGPFVSYTVLAVTCSVFPIIFVVIFWFMPESPYHLVQKDQWDQASQSLRTLSPYGTDEKTIKEKLEEIKETIERDMKNKSTIIELLTKAEYRRPLAVMAGLKIIQYCTGSSAVEVYFQTIMKESKSSISPEYSSIIFGVIQIPAVLLTAVLVDKVGRKPLLLVSSIGCSIASALEGLYFYLQDGVATHAFMDSISWLPITAVVLLTIMKVIGLSTLPFVLLGELFPSNVKEQAVALFAMLGSLMSFLVVKFFEPISSTWGMYTTFWIFAGACAIGTIFIAIVVPETKGKSFMEIQDKLNKLRNK